MSPGRALDALVAEKVFNRLVYRTASDVPQGYKFESADFPGYGDGTFVFPVPPHSTDIAAAWEVVANMRSHGWIWRFEVADSCFARIEKWADSQDGVSGRIAKHEKLADTMPQAICLAALKAVGCGPESWRQGFGRPVPGSENAK